MTDFETGGRRQRLPEDRDINKAVAPPCFSPMLGIEVGVAYTMYTNPKVGQSMGAQSAYRARLDSPASPFEILESLPGLESAITMLLRHGEQR